MTRFNALIQIRGARHPDWQRVENGPPGELVGDALPQPDGVRHPFLY